MQVVGVYRGVKRDNPGLRLASVQLPGAMLLTRLLAIRVVLILP